MKTPKAARLALAVGLLTAASVQAVPTTYSYTGRPFTSVSGPYTTSDFVSGTVTFASPLGDNFPFGSVSPTAFSFSDGTQTITNAGASVLASSFGTGPAGQITRWTFVIQTQFGGGITTSNPPLGVSGDQGRNLFGGGNASNNGTPGSWTSPSSTPTTNPATNVASFSATLNGSLNPSGSSTVEFQYGPTTSYGHTTPVQTQTGNTVRNISANISGLMASTVYHFRIVAHHNGSTMNGSDRTFTTLSVTGPPVVITSPATLLASFSATLNGSVDPHGLTTSVHFQYGTTTSYGLTTAPQSHTGNTYLNISANINGLLASHVYHYRIVASNSAGTTFGSDRTFTTLSATGAPVVTTNPATNVATSSATLNGSVDPHGLTTSVHFQYGTTTSYGLTTAPQSHSGNAYLNISASISGLSASHVYHFRIVATNSAGTRLGSDKTFTTP
ncbi:MAG TPA: hypothetical protein VGF61_22950 [Candidatus Acidoferrum sp.]